VRLWMGWTWAMPVSMQPAICRRNATACADLLPAGLYMPADRRTNVRKPRLPASRPTTNGGLICPIHQLPTNGDIT